MIATVTLNPAVDKTMTGAALSPGQVNRMKSMRLFAGGKGVNVTRILRQMEEPVIGLGFAGGFTGDFILEELKKRGVDCHFTRVQGTTRTTLNILSEDGYVTEILEPGEMVSAEEIENFLMTYRLFTDKSDIVVLSGSLPQGVPADLYARLTEIAKEKECRVILDTSGEALVQGIKAHPYLIKPNVKELEYVMGRPLRELSEIAGAAAALQEEGIPVVVVSRGKRGLLSVFDSEEGKQIVTVSVPDVPVVNTVGSGDCVVASLAWSLQNACKGSSFTGEELKEAIRRAAAYSSANVTTMESGSVPLETAESMLQDVEVVCEPL